MAPGNGDKKEASSYNSGFDNESAPVVEDGKKAGTSAKVSADDDYSDGDYSEAEDSVQNFASFPAEKNQLGSMASAPSMAQL